MTLNAERQRLAEDKRREKNWKRWGSYLSERQWGTVREDYSADGDCWNYFPHDHARSRAYRWGEDGLLGICDREGRLCFAPALWNGRDAILKERLFGLTNSEGNHGEDVKESYFYLDASPTHSYMKALYQYPQSAFPYRELVDENRNRSKEDDEYELADTGIFNKSKVFDVVAEYAKNSPDDVLIKLTIKNRSDEAANLSVLPTLWFRNTWAWGRDGEGYTTREPRIAVRDENSLIAEHESLGRFVLAVDKSFNLQANGVDGGAPQFIFTNNETNNRRLYNGVNRKAHVKDGFHDYVIKRETSAVNHLEGTKAAAVFNLKIEAGSEAVLRLRLCAESELRDEMFGVEFDRTFENRVTETNEFYDELFPRLMTNEERNIARQAYAGLLWTKQFYHFIVKDWLDGDPAAPAPPAARLKGRNAAWQYAFMRDVLSMPDKWEYPWFAAWDTAFHLVAFADIDAQLAKEQLLLFMREWYMHPNGALPAYEFNFNDANPPVHAWACWRVYKIAARREGVADRLFLERAFQKLLLNFTWWVNRQDVEGNNLFGGGFLGLDNIGIFDRSQPLPTGGTLDQADGTAWMAFYSATMLQIALELAAHNPAYEDVASKFFEHFVAIVDAMNSLGGTGLWDETDGFYYDEIKIDGEDAEALRVRSMVGLIPLFAVENLEQEKIDALPGFKKRFEWFINNRPELAQHISSAEMSHSPESRFCRITRLLAIPSRERLARVLGYMLDESEFLSQYGVRSLSRLHKDKPFVLREDGREWSVRYESGESRSGLFGGNSNWRGPVWFPVNYLLVEALERYYHFYGDSLKVECPTGSGKFMNLQQVSDELTRRLARIFLKDARGARAWQNGKSGVGATAAEVHDITLFYEYFDGDTGAGLGASHQTGWTALIARLLQDIAAQR